MIQGKLFLCMTCGGDQLTRPHIHQYGTATMTLYPCPICRTFSLQTEDPNDSCVDWVALGEVVCGRACYEKAYELMRGVQPDIPTLIPP